MTHFTFFLSPPAISRYEKKSGGSGNAASPIPSTGGKGGGREGFRRSPPHPGALVAGGKRGGSVGTIKNGWWQGRGLGLRR